MLSYILYIHRKISHITDRIICYVYSTCIQHLAILSVYLAALLLTVLITECGDWKREVHGVSLQGPTDRVDQGLKVALLHQVLGHLQWGE